MLFSPIPNEVMEEGVLVNQIGYGTFHPGSTGTGSINGKRRAGENMLGLLASQSDFFQALAQNAGAGDPLSRATSSSTGPISICPAVPASVRAARIRSSTMAAPSPVPTGTASPA